jgi:hypothetical protein
MIDTQQQYMKINIRGEILGQDLFSGTPGSGHFKLGNSGSRNSSFRFREVGIAFFF